MNYKRLIHSGDPVGERVKSLSAEEQKQILSEYLGIAKEPAIIAGDQLHPVDTATTVRVQDGRKLTADGPFVEAKEALGGYYYL